MPESTHQASDDESGIKGIQGQPEVAASEVTTASIPPSGCRITSDPIKIQLQERPADPKYHPLSGVIKEELFLISSLILFVGIISTETYYSYFGVKYQFLNLPAFHIVYRGLTSIIASPELLIPYIVAVGWLVLDSYAVRRNWSVFLRFQRPLSYLLLLLVLVIAYPLARRSGRTEAFSDLRRETSSLPTILRLDAKNIKEEDVNENEYRLLMIDSDYIMFFKPLEKDEIQSIPVIHRLPKGEVYGLETKF